MDELNVTKILKKDLGFSSISVEKIKKLVHHLLKQNKRYNLISKSTENSIWDRHILDSAQIIKFIDFNRIRKLADFGSGAGFPGLIISLYHQNSSFHVKLYEKSPVKRDFLKYLINELDIKNISIENNVYEKEIVADVIVCRAFKKLAEIINISREIIKKPHKLIILKGKNAQTEINNVSFDQNYSYKLENSITNHDSKIIIVEVL